MTTIAMLFLHQGRAMTLGGSGNLIISLIGITVTGEIISELRSVPLSDRRRVVVWFLMGQKDIHFLHNVLPAFAGASLQ